jgi:predicted ABC-type transport system involved in lysophospholipase L1 biosynthesis ATPase subunit
MRLMAGLDAPTAGRIRVDGVDVTGMRVQDRKVAMVYQQFINYPSMSVYDNIASPLRLMGKSAAEIDAAVKKTADMMKLGPLLSRRPLELSGGQQQRCALARALVKGASLVLLDEPLANLDYKLREELRAEIPKIFAESGRDLRLCNDRTGRGASAGRQHRHPLGRPRDPVRPDAAGLPPAGRCDDGAGVLGPADELRAAAQDRASRQPWCRRGGPRGWCAWPGWPTAPMSPGSARTIWR